MDETLSYLCLLWHKTSGGPGKLETGTEYGLVLIEAIDGAFNLAPKTTNLCVTTKAECRTVSHIYMCDEIDRLGKYLLYENESAYNNIYDFKLREKCR